MIAILVFSPTRVMSMSIWLGELFCISSATMYASLNVRPRIYASGEISMISLLIMVCIWTGLNISFMMSNRGRVQGSIFCWIAPGRKPICSSSTEMVGRVRMILLHSFFFSVCNAA